MNRSIVLVLLALICGHIHGQGPVKLITLPTLDSTTQRVAFIKKPGDGYLIATRQAGTTGWGSTMISTDDTGEPQSAARVTDNIPNVILCQDSGYLMQSAFNMLVKTDQALNIQWAKKMVAPLPGLFVNGIYEHDGSYYMTASVQESLIDPGLAFYGTYAAIVFKFSAAGDLLDHVILADTLYSSSRYNLYQPTLAFDEDGSLYLSLNMLQYWAAGTCNRQPTVLKLNADLDLMWAYRYPVNIFNSVAGLTMLHDGNLALSGSYGNNYPYCTYFRNYMQKIDTAGNVLWAKSYQHPDPAGHGTFPALELADSTLLFSRTVQDTLGAPVWPFIDHLDANGAVIGSKGFAHPYGRFNYALMLADAGDGTLGVCRMNNWDTVLFTTIDTSLTTYCYSVPNTTIDSAISIARQLFSPAYLSYAFTFSDTLYPPFQPVPFASQPDCGLITGVEEMNGAGTTVFPNPSAGQVTIAHGVTILELVVTDALGRIVHRSAPRSNSASVELPIAGLYLFRIMDGHRETTTRKVIVEGVNP